MENTIESKIKKFVQTEADLGFISHKYAERLIWYIDNYLSEYAASIRPAAEVVVRVPSEEMISEMICGMVFIRGVDLDNYIDEFRNERSGLYDALLSELLRLNPTLTFTDETKST